jgi:hypothetical protein
MKLLSESPHQCNLCSLQRTNPYRNTNAITPSTTHHLTAGKARTRITPSDTLCMSLPPSLAYSAIQNRTAPYGSAFRLASRLKPNMHQRSSLYPTVTPAESAAVYQYQQRKHPARHACSSGHISRWGGRSGRWIWASRFTDEAHTS